MLVNESLVQLLNRSAETIEYLIKEVEKHKKNDPTVTLLTLEEVANILKVEVRFAAKFVKEAKVRTFVSGKKVTRYYASDLYEKVKLNTVVA